MFPEIAMSSDGLKVFALYLLIGQVEPVTMTDCQMGCDRCKKQSCLRASLFKESKSCLYNRFFRLFRTRSNVPSFLKVHVLYPKLSLPPNYVIQGLVTKELLLHTIIELKDFRDMAHYSIIDGQ